MDADLFQPRRNRRRRRRRSGERPQRIYLGRLHAAGLTYRSYGEYGRRVSQPDGSVRVEGAVPGLAGHMCPDYGVPKVAGQRSRDTDNVETFLKEFREFEKQGNLPHFIVMSLGEDHTSGTSPGAFTPQACVASNDLALGRLVEAVSHSKYWPETAIFVIEDDAQNGPDHVDAHRTIGLVISPYTKRKQLDSTQYTTVSMLRTIELILGLPPLSQYDAAAQPDVRLVHRQGGPDRLYAPARAIDLERQEHGAILRRRTIEQDGLQRIRSGQRLRAERNPLVFDQRRKRPDPAGRAPGDCLSRDRGEMNLAWRRWHSVRRLVPLRGHASRGFQKW